MTVIMYFMYFKLRVYVTLSNPALWLQDPNK